MSETRPQKHEKVQGFTLVEVTVATGLTLLLFFAALTVYVAATRLTVSNGAACYAATDAANVVQHTVEDAEEASWIALPGDPGWTSPGTAPASAFQTIDKGTALFTGVELVFPATAAVTVQDAGGAALTVSPVPYNRSLSPSPSPLWIYRADSDGTPDAALGKYLWLMGTERGQAVSKALTGSLNSQFLNAVQFSRPVTASGPPQALPYQLQIKLVSTYYSSFAQAQTSELTTGSQEAVVVGKCVLLRDHELSSDHEPGTPVVYGAANASFWQSD
jgi:hypothetical protein